MKTNTNPFTIHSQVFSHNGHIPSDYTCEGRNINPPLEVRSIPADTKSLALIVEDPDAQHGTYVHWLVWNIRPNEAIAEGSNPGISGINGFGKTGYGGPCPPSGSHRYFFRVYALDTELDLLAGYDKKALINAMKDHILAEAVLMGHYQKRKQKASA